MHTNTQPRQYEPQEEKRLLLRDTCEDVLRRLEQRLSKEGQTWLMVGSFWSGSLRWARNQATMTSDRRDIQVMVMRRIRGGGGGAITNQIDDASLDGVVQSAEWQANQDADRRALDKKLDPWVPPMPTATTWADTTLSRTVEDSARIVKDVTATAQAQALMSAGYIESYGFTQGQLIIDDYGRKLPSYVQMTQAQCSATVRHPGGDGSGWAGLSSFDLDKVNEVEIAKRALDKCVKSLNPVRIEPGRYTTILEPQAVASLVDLIAGLQTSALSREFAEEERHQSPFWLNYDATVGRDRSKLGMKVVDERITISHDPADPELGILPLPGYTPVTWIKNGVLQTLEYPRDYALNELNVNDPIVIRGAYRMSGGTTSIEEMIETTTRGLLVTRFSSIESLDRKSLLATGLTRDGLWLIEKGKITKAVRNFRFTESPLFAFNNVDQLGIPTPVFHVNPLPELGFYFPQSMLIPVIVPPMKVNDFSFTSTIDAI